MPRFTRGLSEMAAAVKGMFPTRVQALLVNRSAPRLADASGDYIECDSRILVRARPLFCSIGSMSWSQLRVACVQMRTGVDIDANVETAGRLCADAADRGADLVVLPEKWPAFGPPAVIAGSAQPLDGPLLQEVASWARRLGVAIVAGSVSERVPGSDRVPETHRSRSIARAGWSPRTARSTSSTSTSTGAACANPTATWPATSSPSASSAAFRLR